MKHIAHLLFISGLLLASLAHAGGEQKTFAELLTPFQTKVDEGGFGFPYKNCEDPGRGDHLVATDKNGQIPAACVPDTFYSWGGAEKLDWFRTHLGDRKAWIKNLPRPLFTTQSPVATFAYGPIALRIKIKPGTKTRFLDEDYAGEYCDSLNETEKQNTLVLRFIVTARSGTALDYIFCSTGPIESWSYGTRAHYDEVVNELSWIKTHDAKDYELYFKMAGEDSLFDTGLDGKDFSEEVLTSNLQQFYSFAASNRGRIYYNTGVPKEEAGHFKTAHPSYFNPRKAGNL
jgi:hypothetical protein